MAFLGWSRLNSKWSHGPLAACSVRRPHLFFQRVVEFQSQTVGVGGITGLRTCQVKVDVHVHSFFVVQKKCIQPCHLHPVRAASYRNVLKFMGFARI